MSSHHGLLLLFYVAITAGEFLAGAVYGRALANRRCRKILDLMQRALNGEDADKLKKDLPK